MADVEADEQKPKALPLLPLYAVTLMRTTAFAVAMMPSFTICIVAFTAAAGQDAAAAASAAGIIAAARSVVEFTAAPILAVWSDRSGRRVVLLASCFAYVIETTLLAVAPSLLVFGTIHILGGFLSSGGAVESSCVADATPPGPSRAVAVGRLFTLLGIALVVGPALGGVLLQNHGQVAPFAFAALMASIAFVVTLLCVPEYLPKSERAQREGLPGGRTSRPSSLVAPLLDLLHRSPRLSWLVAATALASLGQAFYGTITALWLKEAFGWDGTDMGRYFAVIGSMVIATQVLVLPVILKFAHGRESYVLQCCLVTYVIRFVAYSLAPSGRYMFAIIFVTAPAFCAPPLLSSLCTRYVPATQQGLWAGSMSALNTAANVIGALLGSRLFALSLYGYLPLGAPIISSALCYVVAAACVRRAEQSPCALQSSSESK